MASAPPNTRISGALSIPSVAFIAILTLGLATVLAFIDWWRYSIFRNDVDLGIFTQVIASTGHGFSSAAEGVPHLLVHWSPIIIAMWPLLHLFGPIGLQYGQAFLVAATLIPVWALARARLGNRLAAVLACIAALYPLLWANGVGDFHEMAFVPLLSATFVYALDRKHWRLAAVVVLLLFLTKEDQFWILGCNGFILWITARSDRNQMRFGSLMIVVAVIAVASYFPAARHFLDARVAYHPFRFFDWRVAPGTAHEGIAAVLVPRLTYALIILAPLLFLPCVSRYGLFLIPGLIEIAATHRAVILMPGAHYSALLTGYALCAFVDGFRRIRGWDVSASGVAAGTAATLSIGIQIFASPMEYAYYLYRWPNAHDALLDRTLRGLPSKADVGAEEDIFAHLGLDARASVNFKYQQWFVYDGTHFSIRWHDIDEPRVRRLIAKRDYSVIGRVDGIVVLRKTRP
jgi:uncharacterized membrane protein